MKILLTTLNSKYIHSNLALKYLYASAKNYRCMIDIAEFTINQEDDYILTEILRKGYDLVCFSCYIWNVEKTLYLAENLKKAKPDVRILFGGPEVSFDIIPFLNQYRFIDFLISGEGEGPFMELLGALQPNLPEFQELSKIKGLTYRQDGKIYVNSPAPLP